MYLITVISTAYWQFLVLVYILLIQFGNILQTVYTYFPKSILGQGNNDNLLVGRQRWI